MLNVQDDEKIEEVVIEKVMDLLIKDFMNIIYFDVEPFDIFTKIYYSVNYVKIREMVVNYIRVVILVFQNYVQNLNYKMVLVFMDVRVIEEEQIDVLNIGNYEITETIFFYYVKI